MVPPGSRSRSSARRWLTPRLCWPLLAAAAALALAATNPPPAEFEAFAGERLVALLAEEICRGEGLPLAAQLLVRDCPELLRSQGPLLGRLAGAGTRRYNAGLFSLYSTELGGQTLLPGLAIPRYRALTLGGAGQLVVLHTASNLAEAEP